MVRVRARARASLRRGDDRIEECLLTRALVGIRVRGEGVRIRARGYRVTRFPGWCLVIGLGARVSN